MNNVCIIPARGNSKGLKNKNILDFCGKPLISWSIEQALNCEYINQGVYVSSDSDDILNIALQNGSIPIKRPKELSTDTASSESAILHAIDYISKTVDKIDNIFFLQATSPLRSSQDLSNAYIKFVSNGYDSLFSSIILEDFFVWEYSKNNLISMNYDSNNRKRRQDINEQYVENGSFYISNLKTYIKNNNRLSGKIGEYTMENWKVHEIDTKDDFDLCQFLFKKNNLEIILEN